MKKYVLLYLSIILSCSLVNTCLSSEYENEKELFGRSFQIQLADLSLLPYSENYNDSIPYLIMIHPKEYKSPFDMIGMKRALDKGLTGRGITVALQESSIFLTPLLNSENIIVHKECASAEEKCGDLYKEAIDKCAKLFHPNADEFLMIVLGMSKGEVDKFNDTMNKNIPKYDTGNIHFFSSRLKYLIPYIQEKIRENENHPNTSLRKQAVKDANQIISIGDEIEFLYNDHGTNMVAIIGAQRDQLLPHQQKHLGIAPNCSMHIFSLHDPVETIIQDPQIRSVSFATIHGTRSITDNNSHELYAQSWKNYPRWYDIASAGKVVAITSGNESSFLTSGFHSMNISDGTISQMWNEFAFSPLIKAAIRAKNNDYPLVIVGAVSHKDNIVSFGNSITPEESKMVNFITAPGIHIARHTADFDNGTSPAAQYVNGAIALLLEVYPTLSSAQALKVLLETGVKKPEWYGRAFTEKVKWTQKQGNCLLKLRNQAALWCFQQMCPPPQGENLYIHCIYGAFCQAFKDFTAEPTYYNYTKINHNLFRLEKKFLDLLPSYITSYQEKRGALTPEFLRAKLFHLFREESTYYRNDLHIGQALNYLEENFREY